MKIDWIKIKNYYIAHDISLEDLAKKYKISVSSVNKHCQREKWVDLKKDKCKEVDKLVSEKTTEKMVDRKVAANEKHYEQYSKLSEIIDLTLANYLEDIKSGDENSKALPYNLDYLAKIIKEIQRGQRLCLNIGAEDNADAQPEVHIIKGLDEDKI